jgi:hypothetical protein
MSKPVSPLLRAPHFTQSPYNALSDQRVTFMTPSSIPGIVFSNLTVLVGVSMSSE